MLPWAAHWISFCHGFSPSNPATRALSNTNLFLASANPSWHVHRRGPRIQPVGARSRAAGVAHLT
jgi:hypothetical protein